MLRDEPLSLQPDDKIQVYEVDPYELARMYNIGGFFYSDGHTMSGGRYMAMVQRCSWRYRKSDADTLPNIMCLESYDTYYDAYYACKRILTLNHESVQEGVACEVEVWHLVEDAYGWMGQADTCYHVAVWDDAPYDYHYAEIKAEYYDNDGWHVPFAHARFEHYEDAQNWAEDLNASTSPCVTIIRERCTCYGRDFDVMEAWYSRTVLHRNPWIRSDSRQTYKG